MALHGICAFFSVFASCIAFSTKTNEFYLRKYQCGVNDLGCTDASAGAQAGLQIAGVFACSAIAIALSIPTGFLMGMFKEDDHWFDQDAHLIN
jgi:hypothetical protein